MCYISLVLHCQQRYTQTKLRNSSAIRVCNTLVAGDEPKYEVYWLNFYCNN